jgi:hypothetical protein
MRKSDLKTGMRVELGNGKTYIVMINTGHDDVFIRNGGNKMDISCYKEDLTLVEPDCLGRFNVLKVYGAPTYNSSAIDPKMMGDLLWERKEEVPEYTMEQAIAKLGHKFKIVE